MLKPVVFKLIVTLFLTIISLGSSQVSTSEVNINKTRITRQFINNLRIEDSTKFQQSFNPYAVKGNPRRAVKVRSKRDTGQCGQAEDITRAKPLSFGGVEIPHGSWPWLVAIYKGGRGFIEFKCGGTLISKKAILTAAHCFVARSRYLNENEILVYVGRHDIEDPYEEHNQLVRSEKIVPHPEYNSSTDSFDADIAIITLQNEIQYTAYIRPACLWSCDSSVVDEEGFVVGWGRNGRSNSEKLSSTPRKVSSRIVSDSVCLRSNAVYQAITSERTICAGNRDGTGPCAGDSGGGMLIKKNGKWFLRGIVSASLSHPVDFCNLNEYVVYSDIAKFLPWISEVTGQPLSNFIRLQGHEMLPQCNHTQPDSEDCFRNVPYPVKTTYIYKEDHGSRKKGDILFGTTDGVYLRKAGETTVTKISGINEEILIIQLYPDRINYEANYGSVHVITLDGKIYYLRGGDNAFFNQNDVPYPVKAMHTFSEDQGNRKKGDILFGTTDGVYLRKAGDTTVTKISGIDEEILIIQPYPDNMNYEANFGSVHVITLDGKIYYLRGGDNAVFNQQDVPHPVTAMYTFPEDDINYKKGNILFKTANGIYLRKEGATILTEINESNYFNVNNNCYH